MQSMIESKECIQGTEEWLKLRKTKITGTDAAVIMGKCPWKTKWQLYQEKTSSVELPKPNKRMQRGLTLEPFARDIFSIKTRIEVRPKVIVKDWMMASVDGISDDGKCLVEIKCPGNRDHALAESGKVPPHYYPQLQHQMHVCGVEEMIYFSFDGFDGVSVKVEKDKFYVERMIEEEFKFYQCMMNLAF